MNYFETILHNAEMIGWTFLFRRSGSVLVKPDVFKIELTHGGDENYETADELVQLINGWYTAYSNAIKNVENGKITTAKVGNVCGNYDIENEGFIFVFII